MITPKTTDKQIEAFINWLFTPPRPITECCGIKFYNHTDIYLHRKVCKND